MTLSSNEQALFEVGARAIANEEPAPDISLYCMNKPFYGEDVPQFLAETVEKLTEGSRSVRVADNALFAGKVMGIYKYMVVCDGSTPPGKVTELTEDMRLIGAGPYQPGFEFDAKPATDEEVQHYRELVDKSNRERAESEQAKEDAGAFMANLLGLAQNMALSAQNAEATAYIESLKEPTLDQAARAYRMLGTSIQDNLDVDSKQN